MAKSIDSLIKHLIGVIAANPQGLTITQLANSTTAYYDATEEDSEPSSPPNSTTATSYVTIDRTFLSSVWLWLGRHPDISIGENGHYNKTALAQVEAEFPGYVDSIFGPSTPLPVARTETRNSRRSCATLEKQRRPQQALTAEGPRIFLKEERLYQAICGHPPEPKKVSASEFQLLSHIAAAGSEGVLQGELVRKSGQDKRSVPKRTDILHSKGYIIKETVFKNGTRTSRLILKKFGKANTANAELSRPQRSTMRHVVRRVFDILAAQSLIPQARLAEELNLQSPAESAVLQKVLRRLEKLKLVKRARTAVGPSATSNDLQYFVQLLRPAEPEDLDTFDTEKLFLNQDLEELTSCHTSRDQPGVSATDSPVADEEDNSSKERVQSATWNPDRQMSNVLAETVQSAGRVGLTNLVGPNFMLYFSTILTIRQDARQKISGGLVRKQLEALLYRISSESLVVQPPHLRHLAIVRHAVTEDGAMKFFHHSWDEFKQLAMGHGIDISAVSGAKKLLKANEKEETSTTATGTSQRAVDTDEFGFPSHDVAPLQVSRGQATFSSIIGATAARDVDISKGELVVVEQGSTRSLEIRNDVTSSSRRASRSEQHIEIASTSRKVTEGNLPVPQTEEIVKGRPRKYARGTEKFWRVQINKMAAGHDDSDAQALHSRRPAVFDQTLVEAMDAKLPVPMNADHIDQHWIDSTRKVLDRSSEGVYMSPKGLRWDSFNRLSRVIIVKTPRLSSIDWNERGVTQPWQFLSSSASHSFPFRRYYPMLPATAPRILRTPFRSKRHVETRLESTEEKKRPGPRLGIFFEETVPDEKPSVGVEELYSFRGPVDLTMDSTDEDQNLPHHDTMERGMSSARSVLENLSTQRTQTSRRRGKGAARLSDTVIPDTTTPEGTGSIETHPTRSSRKRKLTEKAVQLMETSQGRRMRLFSEARSMASDDSSAIQAPDETAVSNQGLGLLAGIEAAAAASPSIHSSRGTQMLVRASPADVADTVSQSSTARTKPTTVRRAPTTGKRTAESAELDEEQPSAKPRDAKGANALCRKIVLELVKASTGAAPNDHVTLRRIAATRWQEAGEEDRPLSVTMKTALKSLTESGKLKSTTFMFRGKSGSMTTRSVIFLPSINRSSQLVEDVKQKIKEADPVDYVPPEWIAEAARIPLFNKDAPSRTPQIEDDDEELPARERRASPTNTTRRPAKRRRALSTVSVGTTDSNVGRTTRSGSSTNIAQAPAERRRAVSTTSVGTIDSSVGRTSRDGSSTNTVRTPTKRRRAASTTSVGTIDSNVGRPARSGPPKTPEAPPESAANGFLTLQVSALSSIPAVQLSLWRAECPVTALLSDASYANPWRPKGIAVKQRRRRRTIAEPQQPEQFVRWKDFPASLEDILSVPGLKLQFAQCYTAETAAMGPNWQYFACQLEGVRAWEDQKSDAALAKRSQYGFINHTVPEALYFEVDFPSTIQFEALVYFDAYGKQLEAPYPPTESWATFATALQASPEETSLIVGGEGVALQKMPPPPPPPEATGSGLRRTTRKPKPKKMPDNVFFDPSLEECFEQALDDAYEEPPPKRQKKIADSTKKTPKKALSKGLKPRSHPPPTTTPGSRRTRGDRWTQNMSESRMRRIVVSVIVVQTLAGGADGEIDWSIVLPLFPKSKELYLKITWETLSTRSVAQTKALTEEFQGKYLEALEAGKVPSVDFEDFIATDWSAIVEWALRKLSRPSFRQAADSEFDLSQSRDDLLEEYELAFEGPKRYHNVVSHSLAPVKEDVLKTTIFGIPKTLSAMLAPFSRIETTLTKNSDLHLAKSYALASILTPSTTFNGPLAHAKLSTLSSDPKTCERLLGEALFLLQSQNFIQRLPKKHHVEATHNDPSGMRSWEIHPSFFSRFESTSLVSPDMLRRAAEFKLSVLDPAFADGDIAFLEKAGDVSDGEVLAVLNLISQGHVRCRPGPDVPRTRYGTEHERLGYRTRGMNKSSTDFGVELHPTQSYPFGDTMAQGRSVPIPRRGADEERGRIPAWIDIHGNLNTPLWDIFVTGVLGLMSQLPGISSMDVSKAFGHALEVEEVEMILGWCEHGGFVRTDGKTAGWRTAEWWWLCIDGHEGEHA
ncbi:hypothetical protein H2200_002814 [Cladophialophora chaetospira]|uniref:TFIIIC transcription initiation factor complex subunits Tfc3 n=1 Tax=Cladophialophora chaetospira TaxID=386627 RepID=A0AA39CM53_9EURO|nr:hypothetical protein H2200_002814 [Cladophialophora chaetospira]